MSGPTRPRILITLVERPGRLCSRVIVVHPTRVRWWDFEDPTAARAPGAPSRARTLVEAARGSEERIIALAEGADGGGFQNNLTRSEVVELGRALGVDWFELPS